MQFRILERDDERGRYRVIAFFGPAPFSSAALASALSEGRAVSFDGAVSERTFVVEGAP